MRRGIALQAFFTLIVGFLSVTGPAAADSPVDFNQDIRPLLSDRCFACHGPDEEQRQAGLRLDVKDGALGETDSGEIAIVPGDVEASAVYHRITSDDPGLRMPPADSNKSLSPEEIELIRRWIAQGADWQEHWAFVPPEQPALPTVQNRQWPQRAIDFFVLARLEAEGLSPSPPASKERLLRRVTLDLTGLPPTLEEMEAFLADESPQAYEKVVDRLLRSPRYGEHRARYWLDMARYGDTHGLHLDNYREMWPYRDWVVRAFNGNLPYDRFIIEQLAGDLLPNPTLDQLIATGFNRCHVTTNEGGSIEEEVYVRNVIDRVVTVGTVFMGLTFDCTRCHDHKYDPLTMRDFYSMFAYFNSIDGSPMDGNAAVHPPVVKVPTAQQQEQLAHARAQIAQLRQEIEATVAKVDYQPAGESAGVPPTEPQEYVWIDDQLPEGVTAAAEGREDGQWQFVEAPEPVFSGQRAWKRTSQGRSQDFFHEAAQGLRIGSGDTLVAYVYLDPDNPPREIMLQWNTGQWQHRAYWGENLIDWGKDDSPERRRIGELPEAGRWVRLEVPAADVGIPPGTVISGWAFTQFDGTVYWDKAGVVTRMPQSNQPFTTLAAWLQVQRATEGAGLPDEIRQLVTAPADQLQDDQQRALRDYFVEHAYVETRPQFEPLHHRLRELEQQVQQIEQALPTTLIYRERSEPRPAFILKRGEYDQQGEPVSRATPTVLPPPAEGAPVNRLGLAQWLVDPRHPLTARVAVNQFWQQLFGVGLVKTAEDFGSQGEPPSHPQLLDWLAVQFLEQNWDVKWLMKEIVMSATYQQSARITPELRRRDPANRLLARGPRYRLDAEMLRDQALALSGLLVEKMGGPSVKPPQPDGLWYAVGYSGSNTVRFKKDEGPDKVHRRTLYTFIKRTAPPPQLSTFDGPSRESCIMRRERTNTPLQALLLMSDPQYVEAARALAERTLQEGGSQAEDRVQWIWRLATGRRAQPAEVQEVLELLEDQLQAFQADPQAAEKLIAVGEIPPDQPCDPVQLAAWTMVANLILNLDEVINKG